MGKATATSAVMGEVYRWEKIVPLMIIKVEQAGKCSRTDRHPLFPISVRAPLAGCPVSTPGGVSG